VYDKCTTQSRIPTLRAAGQQVGDGIQPITDKGLQLVLKNNNQSKTAPSFYNPWDLPGARGGDDLPRQHRRLQFPPRRIGDFMRRKTATWWGPPKTARTRSSRKTERVLEHQLQLREGQRPKYGPVRGFACCRLRPMIYEEGNRPEKRAAAEDCQLPWFFIEGHGAGQVTGRITPISGKVSGTGNPPVGAFPMAILIVK
jgi:hypothetical protein